MRMFRLLKPEEIECRISEIAKDGSWLTLLLYKTARTDASLLDEVVGPYSWANDYRVIDGKMYCGVGIKGTDGEWVWKWNVGTESNTEAEKGEASDALKRAGFVWGIGTELYSAPRIYIRNDACEIKQRNDGKFVCYDRFAVQSIAYDAGERICALEIVNQKTGRIAFKMGAPKAAGGNGRQVAGATAGEGPAPGRQTRMGETGTSSASPSATEGAAPAKHQCRRCGIEIDEATANASYAESKRILCPECLQAYRDWKAQQGGARND